MGLCGSFSSEISKRAIAFDKKENFDQIYVVGARTVPAFRKMRK